MEINSNCDRRHFPEVHGERLEGEAEVLLVVEAAEEAEAVELVLGVGVVEAAQHLGLLQTRLVHYLVVPEIMQRVATIEWYKFNGLQWISPDDFDGDLPSAACAVSRPHHVREDALARVAEHVVALV